MAEMLNFITKFKEIKKQQNKTKHCEQQQQQKKQVETETININETTTKIAVETNATTAKNV